MLVITGSLHGLLSNINHLSNEFLNHFFTVKMIFYEGNSLNSYILLV